MVAELEVLQDAPKSIGLTGIERLEGLSQPFVGGFPINLINNGEEPVEVHDAPVALGPHVLGVGKGAPAACGHGAVRVGRIVGHGVIRSDIVKPRGDVRHLGITIEHDTFGLSRGHEHGFQVVTEVLLRIQRIIAGRKRGERSDKNC